ncbi:hypothetical protein K439DRAFT_1633980 [Ramaria rubella]|nr:hypothetical protein K439DRAFT_1633980 [Ramaria rubella]
MFVPALVPWTLKESQAFELRIQNPKTRWMYGGSVSTSEESPMDTPVLPYHADFTGPLPEADTAVTLISRDRIRFLVSANVLRAASEVFATALSLPQPQATRGVDGSVIDNLDEDSTTMEILLRMITAKEIPRLDTFEGIGPLALAADKWHMPGPLSYIRMLLVANTHIHTQNPIQLYCLGIRLGWEDLIQLGSMHSCDSDLYSKPELQLLLEDLDGASLFRLIKFYRTRHDVTNKYFGQLDIAAHLRITPEYEVLRGRFLDMIDSTPSAKPLDSLCISNLIVESYPEVRRPSSSTFGSLVKTLESLLKKHWDMLPKSA